MVSKLKVQTFKADRSILKMLKELQRKEKMDKSKVIRWAILNLYEQMIHSVWYGRVTNE